ncbi:hypothetical protein HGRIS_011390 [Hohenbuehelia grisea]|uniref:BUB1 N-terminal domain-containing protein n=1 Tax=Hohenbuehelia grisea TaxID=104357 RepID=A0ABR3JWY1_9AGAR
MTTEDDVFQDNGPSIVDCDILEACKENVQPLASGRRVTSLSTVLATPHGRRDAKLAATRNRLRINVELALEDSEDSPLEAYCQLIYWTVDNYPQGHSAESGLLELLEEATRVLKDDRDGCWRGELKYLKLWVLYASFVEKPSVIYKFLLVNDIGTDHALFYEEYAMVLERDKRRGAADEMYMLGIARRAAPLDRLESRYREFQKRMMTAAAAPPPEPPVSEPVAPKRKALRTTSVATPGPRPIPAPTLSNPPPNGRLQIFVDPTGEQAEAAEGNPWPELGGRKTRVKENVPETKKMGGTAIKQAGRSKRVASAASGASSSRIAVFRDPVDSETPRIVPYRDSDAGEMPPPAAPASKSKAAPPETPAKPTIVPFRDPPADVPSTPQFTPFRDETASLVSPASHVPHDSVMKSKPGVAVASVAEALRKDPLKNYAADMKQGVDD